MSDNLPNKNDFVSISHAAKLLGVSIDTVRRWDQQGTLKSVRLDGKNRFFSKTELREFKRNRPLSISEAAIALSVSVSTLRRLEERGVNLAERDANGERLYSPQKIREYLTARKNQTARPHYDLFAPVKPAVEFPAAPASTYAPAAIPPQTAESLTPPKNGGGVGGEASFWKKNYMLKHMGQFSSFSAYIPTRKTVFGSPKPTGTGGLHFPNQIPEYKRAVAGLGLVIFLSVGVLAFTVFRDLHAQRDGAPLPTYATDAQKRFANLTPQQRAELSEQEVLAATSANGVFSVNIRSQFNEDINGDNIDLNIGTGNLTAGNVIYSITAGQGISITPGQNPVISSTGVSSIGGVGGAILLGSGLTISGNTLSSSTTGITGLEVGSTTLTGSTIKFSAGGGISLSADSGSNTITISGSSAPDSGWTLSGNNLYPTSTSYIVGIGTTAPTATLDVAGTLAVSGTTTFNGVTYTWPGSDAAASGYVLSSDGSGNLAWINAGGGSINYFDQIGGALYPQNSTVDFLVGGSSTASAKFAVLNIDSGTPTASLSASGVGTYLTANGSLQTANSSALTIGGSTTGNIILSPLNGIAGSSVAPSTNQQVDLGTATAQFNNVYGTTFYANGVAGITQGSASCVTTTGGIVTGFGTCQLGSEQWVVNNGVIYTGVQTLDLVLGGTSTASARFAVLNIANDAPVASLSASNGQGVYLSYDGSLQTTSNQTLTLGGDTTGDITLSPFNGSGTVTSTGNITLSSGKTYQINGITVLSSSTLGTG
ncbi:MAG: MerR family DNA-binding transcriptional regulator, partial [Candidatus Levybacteria bacterium]|nr:MerR family DNA-binding transcriptional regulator [Candidatus Levybacteria bacterium]